MRSPVIFLGVVWTFGLASGGQAMGQTASAGDPSAGAAIFQDRCVSCHLPQGGGQGPSLKGVFGRKAASSPGFSYTAALKTSGLTWTQATLDHFLTNPAAVVAGTAMSIRLSTAKQRADVISYFASRR